MSATINKVILIGNLGDEVKTTRFEGGGVIGRFPIATTFSYINKTTNERVEETEWHNIVVRNKTAEICDKYLKKGKKVYVEGRLKTRKWQDQNGQDRYTTEVVCNTVKFLSPLDQNTTQQSANPSSSNAGPQSQEEDDLPF